MHPNNLSVQYTAASIALIQLEVEMKLKDITEAAGGFMTCNGAPLTRTEIMRGFGQHVAENAFQQISEHVQVFTPIMLNRPPGGCDEIDPKYHRDAKTMATGLYDPDKGCAAVCWNVLAHLDFGVLSELDQGEQLATNFYPCLSSTTRHHLSVFCLASASACRSDTVSCTLYV